MTAITLARKTGAPWVSAIAKFLSDVAEGIREGHEMASRYEELSRLSDAALAARGLTREELPQAIATGRAGR
jgi:uncharacterized protein YjiS (DUF1127 family)